MKGLTGFWVFRAYRVTTGIEGFVDDCCLAEAVKDVVGDQSLSVNQLSASVLHPSCYKPCSLTLGLQLPK